MSSAIEKLTFTVLLMDKISKPSQGVCKSIEKMQKTSRQGLELLAKGAAGITATSLALHAFTGPARDFTRAIGEVASLDVAQDELEKLGARSKDFARQFGGNAAEIVRSGYDIQSAIPGLASGALAEFTYQGALLAKAGKSNATTITSYFGTMYNIFEKDAKKIGQAEWVEQLAGKTAHAIKIFKTTGDNMSAAFENLGATGQTAGVSLDEQLAVLGTLQSTMGGARAGTAYRAFLNKTGQAQKALGMEFTDSAGKMLPIVEILEKIREKVGPGQLTLANQTALMKAFGEEGGKAVVNLLDKTENLKGSIGDLGNITGSEGALKMAESMTDPLDRFTGTLGVLKTTIGESLLPTINLALSAMARVLGTLQWLMDKLPPLRWLIGAVVIGVSALTLAWSGFIAITGLKKMLFALFSELKAIQLWCYKAAHAHGTMTTAQKISAVATMAWSKVVAFAGIVQKSFNAGMSFLITKLRVLNLSTVASTVSMWAMKTPMAVMTAVSWLASGGLTAAATAAWAFAVALWATGIPAIVLAVVALVGALALVWYYFDDLNAILLGLGDYLFMILGPLGWIALIIKNWDDLPSIFTRLWEGIKIVYNWIVGKLTPCIEFIAGLFSGLGEIFGHVWDEFMNMLPSVSGVIDSIGGAISKVMGFFGGNVEVSASTPKATHSVVPEMQAARQRTLNDIPAGGVYSNSNRTTNYGGVTINSQRPFSPGDLEDWAELQA